MPERTILPKVYQQPHPPMWVAVTSPGTELDAADRGLGSLGLTFGQFAEQEKKHRRVPPAHPALRAGRRLRQRPGQHGELPLLPRGRRDAASRTGQAHGGHVQLPRDPAHLRARGLSRAAPTRRSASCRSSAAQATGPDASEQAGEGLALGGPERIIRALKRWEAVGVDRVNFLLNAMEVIPQAEVLDSLRLFAQGGDAGVRDEKPPTPARRGERADARSSARSTLEPVAARLPALRQTSTLRRGRCPGPRFSSSPSRSPRATRRAAAARDAPGHPARTQPGCDALSREPGGPVHPRPAAPDGTGRARIRAASSWRAVASTPEAAAGAARAAGACPSARAR